MKYDMHMHSTFSDGSDDVNTLIDKVKKAGIDFFSITDHDTALSARKILSDESLKQKIHNNGLKYVTGVEWSALYNETKMHILAYDFDPFLPEIAKFEEDIKNLLKEKTDFRLKFVSDGGFTLSEKSLKFLETRENVRKIDLANCLVNDGYFDTIDDAIQKFLNGFKYPKEYRLDAKELVGTLSKCGAKMVWAHSIHGLNEKPLSFEKIEEVVSELAPYGLSGLECYYSLFSKSEIDKLLEIAKKYNLFVTIGSDYHGENKTVALGEISSDGTEVDLKNIKLDKIFKNIIS